MSKKIEQLELKIKNFEEQQIEKKHKTYLQKHQNINIVYNVFADLLGGIITAFILNNIYKHFFEKNDLVFALLLIICSIAGLYNTMRYFFKKNNNDK